MNKTARKNKSTATVIPSGNLTEDQKKIAALRQEALALEANIAAEETKAHEATKKLVDGLGSVFGVSTAAEVIQIIKQHAKIPAKDRTVLTPALKTAILADLNAKTMTGSEIAAKHKISLSSVMKVKSENGLVKKRTPKAVAAAA